MFYIECVNISGMKSLREVAYEIWADIEPISLAENWKHYLEYEWSTAPLHYCPVCKGDCVYECEECNRRGF